MKVIILVGNLAPKSHNIDIETGLYFGKKNKYLENKNILIAGLTTSEEQEIYFGNIKI